MVEHNKTVYYIPDGKDVKEGLLRTTDLCIAAHQDDIEIMAYGPIVDCYGQEGKWFTGVVVTDGAGSPRSGVYEQYTDEEMKEVRVEEQKSAALIGKYAAQIFMAQKSSDVKNPNNTELIHKIRDLILECAPKVLYTHNLADKHDTHVGVTLNVLRALKLIEPEKRPEKLISLEVWRSLDWLCDEDKTVFDTSGHPNVSAAILGVFDSQIAGGKRYDLASVGRRLANATYFASHDVDATDSLSFGLDITELMNGDITPAECIGKYIARFETDVQKRLAALS